MQSSGTSFTGCSAAGRDALSVDYELKRSPEHPEVACLESESSEVKQSLLLEY